MSKKFIYINEVGMETEAESFETSDFTAVGGLAKAGKPVILDAAGKIDATMIDASAIDHGQLSGLGDDDHLQYLPLTGVRAMTGNLQLGANEAFSSATPSSANSLVTKAYADAIGVGNRMKGNVAVATTENIALSGLLLIDGYQTVAGDRVLAKNQTDKTDNGIYIVAAGAWTRSTDLDNAPQGEILNGVIIPRVINSASGQETKSFYISSVGTGLDGVHVIGTDNIVFDLYTTSTQLSPGMGINFNGNIVEIDLANADSGLIFDANNDLSVDWATSVTDHKAWKASDLNASKVPLIDAGNNTAMTDVEGAIDELYGMIAENGVEYTVATGGINKGDLAYLSGNNIVGPYANLNLAHRGIGLALETANVGDRVKILANDTVLKNVLSGATAGAPYYWNGTALSTTMPSGSGSHVWQVGIASSTTDLHVEVRFIKKNS